MADAPTTTATTPKQPTSSGTTTDKPTDTAAAPDAKSNPLANMGGMAPLMILFAFMAMLSGKGGGMGGPGGIGGMMNQMMQAFGMTPPGGAGPQLSPELQKVAKDSKAFYDGLTGDQQKRIQQFGQALQSNDPAQIKTALGQVQTALDGHMRDDQITKLTQLQNEVASALPGGQAPSTGPATAAANPNAPGTQTTTSDPGSTPHTDPSRRHGEETVLKRYRPELSPDPIDLRPLSREQMQTLLDGDGPTAKSSQSTTTLTQYDKSPSSTPAAPYTTSYTIGQSNSLSPSFSGPAAGTNTYLNANPLAPVQAPLPAVITNITPRQVVGVGSPS